MERSISEILEDVKIKMCEEFCKYPHSPVPEGKTTEWLMDDPESPCANCPLDKL